MSDQTKSNPAFFIIGFVTFIVAVFFIGNVVAYVPSPSPPLLPLSFQHPLLGG